MSHEERPPIRLDQFLKQQGAVGTGGHAKVVIQAGEVTVNGVVETRRRKQLAPGDVVAYAGEQWRVEVTQEG
jgi:ribosome-associated protein